MEWKYKISIFFCYLSAGITTPIMSLLLLSRGCNLQTIGLTTAVLAGTVIIAEVPSGIFADLFGRKQTYMLSRLFGCILMITLLFSKTLPLLMLSMVFSGLSIAFASGSLDAMAIENAINRCGEKALTKAVSTFTIYQCSAFALGALISGFLPVYEGYSLHIVVKGVCSFIALLITFALPSETRPTDRRDSSKSFITHIKTMSEVLRHSTAVISVLICIIAVLIVQAPLENYWQPYFVNLVQNSPERILGILAAGANICAVLGSFVMGRADLEDEPRRWKVYLTLDACLPISIIILSLTKNVPVFSIVYFLFYLMLGMVSVPEQVIINKEATNEIRASIMSVPSLAARVGGILSGVFCSALLTKMDVPNVWRVCAGITLFSLIIVCVIQSKGKRKMAR